jgi:hypothetical protein
LSGSQSFISSLTVQPFSLASESVCSGRLQFRIVFGVICYHVLILLMG